MYDFLVQYWQFISSGILVVLSIILLILRKKKIVVEDSMLDGIYSYAIQLINEAERRFKLGEEKKEFVVSSLKEKYPQFSKFLNFETLPFTSKPNSDEVFGQVIETILSTPQRKEKKR